MIDEMSLLNDINYDFNKYEEDFYLADIGMKQLLNNGYYITVFDPKNIIVSNGRILFKQYAKYEKQDQKLVEKSNIESLMCLFVGLGFGHSESLLPMDFLREHFDIYKSSLPSDTRDYIDEAVNDNKIEHYTDFIDNKTDNLSNNMAGKSSSLIKSTPAGRAFYATSDNSNAFAYTLILPIITVLVSLFIIFLVIYFG